MARLEELTRGALVKGIRADGPVEVLDVVKWHGTSVVELTYKGTDGKPGNELLFRDREASLEVSARGPAWDFDTDGQLFQLVAEAYRIKLAYLFDPLLAVHTQPRRAPPAPDPGRLRRDAAPPGRSDSSWPTTPGPARRSCPASSSRS